jgi:hypothetical protein
MAIAVVQSLDSSQIDDDDNDDDEVVVEEVTSEMLVVVALLLLPLMRFLLGRGSIKTSRIYASTVGTISGRYF